MRSFKIHRCLNFIRSRFTTSKNKLGQDSPFPKFLHLKIRRRNGVESLTTLEEGEFKFAIDGCISFTGIAEMCMILRAHTLKLRDLLYEHTISELNKK